MVALPRQGKEGSSDWYFLQHGMYRLGCRKGLRPKL
jgi:hypothetical protein